MFLNAKIAKSLLKISEIGTALLPVSGLSDYFTEKDKNKVTLSLIKKFLEPAGKYFADDAVYRYLLNKCDSLCGSMRNIVETLTRQKLIRTLLFQLVDNWVLTIDGSAIKLKIGKINLLMVLL